MMEPELTRRSLLRILGVGAAATAVGGLTTACNLVGSSDKPSGDKVRIKVMLVPDPTGASQFYREQFDRFEEKNPDIEVQIIENPTDQQVNAIELSFQQGDPPDVFRAQDNGFDRIFDRGWIAPLDQYVTDEFTSRFPEGSLDPATSGLHRDGKLYTLPLVWGKWSVVRFLLVNNTAAKVGGITTAPKTWEELEQAAAAITRAGGGRTFGFAGLWSKSNLARMFQHTAGPSSIDNGIDLRTGRAAINHPSLAAAVDLLTRMHAAKTMTPGWESWTDASKVHTAFAKGELAMFLAAPYQINEVRKLNPQLDMTIAAVPVPAAGRGGYSGQTASFSPLWSMSAQSKHPEQAWKVMDFLASKDFHRAYYEKFGTLTALESAWQDKAASNADQKAIMDIAAETVRLIPNPVLASKGGKELMSAIRGKQDLQWSEIALPAILRNQPFDRAAADLNAKLDAFIDEQAKAISAKGTPASRADLTFPTWNPLQPFNPSQK
ncbi:ABC transporter substrate-binding protein [Micromonospora globbae]|uniref:Extracellular solute-binding protein n=1 Tax=Micromonospora globbae TaxID=1894969 RepID=A0ABZ1SE80_9ACTN|nr:extracellular solute-binding protein [Micromonospora globbae]WTF88681.1 extracellular solute-binding protein [Micromonospora globbae]